MILTSASQLQFEHEPNDSLSDGYGDGDGYGYGDGDGNGYSYGNGNGDGDGYGYGNGNGYGDGDGYGSGDGYGDGCGDDLNFGDKFITTVVDAVSVSPLRFVVDGKRVGFWDAWEAATEEEKRVLILWMPVVQGTTNN